MLCNSCKYWNVLMGHVLNTAILVDIYLYETYLLASVSIGF